MITFSSMLYLRDSSTQINRCCIHFQSSENGMHYQFSTWKKIVSKLSCYKQCCEDFYCSFLSVFIGEKFSLCIYIVWVTEYHIHFQLTNNAKIFFEVYTCNKSIYVCFCMSSSTIGVIRFYSVFPSNVQKMYLSVL